MSEAFLKLIALARENIQYNPSLKGKTGEAVALQYLSGLMEEIEEVKVEIRADNQIYLTDELSDIAWDYACVLAQLEQAGYIERAEDMLTLGLQKYTERAPAFLEMTNERWNVIKAQQKLDLKQRHQEMYGA